MLTPYGNLWNSRVFKNNAKKILMIHSKNDNQLLESTSTFSLYLGYKLQYEVSKISQAVLDSLNMLYDKSMSTF